LKITEPDKNDAIKRANKMIENMVKCDMRKAEGYKLVLTLCLKMLETDMKENMKQIANLIKKLLKDYLKGRAKCIQVNFFTEYLGSHLSIAWNFLVPLLKLGFPKDKGGARTEFQREIALKLAANIIKRTSKSECTEILEKVFRKYNKVIKLTNEALDINTWKNPMKYWMQYLTFCISLTKILKRSQLLTVRK
jgi:hypothetical protein